MVQDASAPIPAGAQYNQTLWTGGVSQPTKAKARVVSIQQLDHGYMVTVGCQSFAIERIDKIIADLKAYLVNPQDVERLWLEGKFEI